MNERRETIKALEKAGFQFHRHGGNHDLYRNPQTGKQIPVKRHNFDKETAAYILREAGLK